jgi:ribosomal-protein-alanine N-acetyltransferase
VSAVFKEPGSLFRPMGETDLATIIAIEHRAYAYPWTLGIMRDCLRVGYSCWVFEREGEILGYAFMSIAAGEGHLLNICVRPELQGKGLGKKLLRHLLSVARRQGADTLFLEVRPSNTPAVQLYQSVGFNEVGQRKEYYPDHQGREDALVFAYSLL